MHQFKPSVLDEVDYALHYFQQVLFNAMPQLRGRIAEALNENYPDVQMPPESFCNFGYWVGLPKNRSYKKIQGASAHLDNFR